ncbi:hemerythrin domain-containing protein [Rhizobium sp. AG855]|uniref:hemerythrin domain-containing protein n=1 Tax=Rhizobium sp. AG855 TaxID=2183898 RepID=UPI000E7380E6|nr:hemerythrin domain-containing protein [Rhizobium sp. AG855]RKE83302.1 hemerythrin HHE cation binding domain-containing protein [Rhizobium sp. AG855]
METNGTNLTVAEVRALEDKHRDLLVLCLRLEEFAIDFDAGEVPRGIGKVAKHIEPLMAAAHTLEEQKLYPDLQVHAGSCFGSLLLDQVKSEHRVDRRAAHELSLTLAAVARKRCRLSLETVAHMVRGFQEAVRRHITAEQMLLQQLLSVEPERRALPR